MITNFQELRLNKQIMKQYYLKVKLVKSRILLEKGFIPIYTDVKKHISYFYKSEELKKFLKDNPNF